MTVKLAILKSGENIISNIKEAYYEDKLTCYIFENPHNVIINGSYKILDDPDETNNVSISLHSWPSLSADTVAEIALDWVVTLVEPNVKLKQMYENQVLTND